MNTASFIYMTITKFTLMEDSIVAQTLWKKQQEKLKEEFLLSSLSLRQFHRSKGGNGNAFDTK